MHQRAGRPEQELLVGLWCPAWIRQVPVRTDSQRGNPALGVVALGHHGRDPAAKLPQARRYPPQARRYPPQAWRNPPQAGAIRRRATAIRRREVD